MRLGDSPLQTKYENWFSNVTLASLPGAVFLEAASLRARFPSLKTPDAIHLAAATNYGCHEFWTNDNRLMPVNSLKIRNIAVEESDA